MSDIDYVYLGSAPGDEDCAQLGDPDYAEKSRSECQRYIELILKVFEQHHGREPRCRVRRKSQQHDFGTYYEVVASFDYTIKGQVDDAYWIEENAPTSWG